VIFSVWALNIGSAWPAPAGPYTLTIFADQGKNPSSAATQASSGGGSNLGHVFIELTNGNKQVYLGYYGDRQNPAKGQLRPDADLARNGYWDVKKTFEITEQGYNDAHKMIDTWGTKVGSWKPWCNCADFAEAIATVAGVRLGDLPKMLGNINTPGDWSAYLKRHGGTVNPQRTVSTQDVWSIPPNLKGTDLINYCDNLYKACNAGCEKYAPNNLHIVECGGDCGIKANKCAAPAFK
jgi:hypothetical protein